MLLHLRGSRRQRRPGLRVLARAAVLLALALGVLLPALAAASPPDSTWLPGLYDDADFDDVVIQIGLLAGLCGAFGPAALAIDSLVRPLMLPGRRPRRARCRSPLRGRAPPLI